MHSCPSRGAARCVSGGADGRGARTDCPQQSWSRDGPPTHPACPWPRPRWLHPRVTGTVSCGQAVLPGPPISGNRARRWGDAQKLPRVGGDVGTWRPPSQQHAKLGYVSGGFEHAELSPGSVCHWDSHASSRSGSWNEVIVPVGKVGLRRRVFAPFGVFPRSSGCPGRRVRQREHGENIHQAGELPGAATATCHTRQLEQQKFVLVQLWRRKSGARRGPGAPSAAAGVCARPLPAPGALPALSEAPRPRHPDPRPPPRPRSLRAHHRTEAHPADVTYPDQLGGVSGLSAGTGRQGPQADK